MKFFEIQDGRIINLDEVRSIERDIRVWPEDSHMLDVVRIIVRYNRVEQEQSISFRGQTKIEDCQEAYETILTELNSRG